MESIKENENIKNSKNEQKEENLEDKNESMKEEKLRDLKEETKEEIDEGKKEEIIKEKESKEIKIEETNKKEEEENVREISEDIKEKGEEEEKEGIKNENNLERIKSEEIIKKEIYNNDYVKSNTTVIKDSSLLEVTMQILDNQNVNNNQKDEYELPQDFIEDKNRCNLLTQKLVNKTKRNSNMKLEEFFTKKRHYLIMTDGNFCNNKCNDNKIYYF